MNNTILTVLLPVYNTEKYLKEAIDSILNQTFVDFELLIIDDGSTDNALDIIQNYHDLRIKLTQNYINKGIVFSLNKGLSLAKGRYIAIMHADDISQPQRLEKQIFYLENNPQTVLLATTIQLIDENNNPCGLWMNDSENLTWDKIRQFLPYKNCLAHPSVMFRRDIIQQYGYKKIDQHIEDYGLWLRLAADGHRIEKLDEILLHYRIHENSLTTNIKSFVHKEIIISKLIFLCTRIIQLKIRTFEIQVCKHLLKHIDDLFFHNQLNHYFQKLKKTWYFFRFCLNWRRLRFIFQLIIRCRQTSLFFCFSRNNIGGAEKVHYQVANSLAEKKPIVFFVKHLSKEKNFHDRYDKKITLIDITPFQKTDSQKQILFKILSWFINARRKAVFFGSMNTFYYDLLPYLHPKITKIDLTHGFGSNIELYSLKFVYQLNERIVIWQDAIQIYKKIYTENNIDLQLLNRLKCIPVQIPYDKIDIQKKPKQRLQLIYVGRDSPEKRIYLLAQIAQRCFELNILADFIFVGNITSLTKEQMKYCQFKGDITDENELNFLYQSADILLLTSQREGFPLVIMEAMLNKVIPICTNVGGISEKIDSGNNGFLIDNTLTEIKIVQVFVKHIQTLSDDRRLLNLMAQNTHQTAHQYFSNYKSFEQTYKELFEKYLK